MWVVGADVWVVGGGLGRLFECVRRDCALRTQARVMGTYAGRCMAGMADELQCGFNFELVWGAAAVGRPAALPTFASSPGATSLSFSYVVVFLFLCRLVSVRFSRSLVCAVVWVFLAPGATGRAYSSR